MLFNPYIALPGTLKTKEPKSVLFLTAFANDVSYSY
jgi:hypothetical protein